LLPKSGLLQEFGAAFNTLTAWQRLAHGARLWLVLSPSTCALAAVRRLATKPWPAT